MGGRGWEGGLEEFEGGGRRGNFPLASVGSRAGGETDGHRHCALEGELSLVCALSPLSHVFK